jgi:predicted short-subunit dehydrogenase-like oxidoreductase (DUF2520 family)
MIDTIRVIGAGGRVGSSVSARLRERGVRLDGGEAELVLLCVPDRAITEVAAEIAIGPWIGHVSGATPLSALDPHTRRFGLHPLQTFSNARGSEQLDGAWAAITAETAEAREVGLWLAETLGLVPFVLDDDLRAPYHAGATFASNYLVTLRALAGSLLESAGAPPGALEPLMRGVIDGGFELTGPIARGDWETVDRHLEAIREHRPGLEELYLALAEATASIAGREMPRALRGSEPQGDFSRFERGDQRLRDHLQRPPADLARLAESRERLLLGQALPLHEDPLRALDRLPRRERLRERLGLLAQRRELVVASPRGLDRG